MNGWICGSCGFHNEDEKGVYCDGCGLNRHKQRESMKEYREIKKQSSYFENTGKYKKGKR